VNRPGARAGTRPGARVTPGAAATRAILSDTNTTSVHFHPIALLQSVLHVGLAGELNDTFALSLLVGESHFTALAHDVFQILPAGGAAQVVHVETIVRASRRPEPFIATTPGIASSSVATTASAAPSEAPSTAAEVTASAATAAAGHLNAKPLAKKFPSVQVMARVFSVSLVLEFHESVSILQQDFTQPPILVEKLFDIPLPSFLVETSNVDAASHLQRCKYLKINE
jgi:hypothetical protein